MMMILGMFVFTMRTAAYQQLQRSTAWRHASNDRVGDMPAYQFVGRGEDTITLDGSIVPEFGMPSSVSALRRMADTGRAFALIGGTGKVFGMYVITDIKETQRYFFKDGTPRQIDFNISLTQVQRSLSVLGNIASRLLGYLG